jgi:3-oxoacyl-[acyl-carrier-protein] synthase II
VRKRVVITGMGVICSAGRGVDEFRKSLIAGKTCISRVEDPRIAHFGPQFAGLVGEIDSPELEDSAFSAEDRFVKLAYIAACEALKQSGVALRGGERTGLILGTCSGPMLTIEDLYLQEINGSDFCSEDLLFKKQYYSAAMLLASAFGIKGPAFTVTTACSAFNAAIAAAGDLIRCGILDTALVGGADALSITTLCGFAGLKATSRQPSAPFSLPSGLNLGEGAGFLVLEESEYARSRGATITGEILGYGLSNDAYHCSAPDPSGKGASFSMQLAFRDSGVTPEVIGYISAHGTGTEANDKAETKAIKKVFGEWSGSVPVSSLKSMVGHCLGAAGAVETVASLICSKNGIYPPTANFTVAREGCNLDYVPDAGRSWKGEHVFIKNNFAFGGNNASVIVSTGSEISIPENGIPDTDPVCISGIGVVSAAGIGWDKFEDFSVNGITFREKVTRDGSRLRVAEVPDFELSSIDRKLNSRGIDRAGKMACAAGALALKNAGISDRPSSRSEIGFYMNLAHGSTWAEPEHIRPLLKNGYQLEQINVFPFIVPNSVTGTVCRVLSLTGYNNTFCNGPGAGLLGLGMAWAAVKNNHASAFLCGTVDDMSEQGLIDCFLSEKGKGAEAAAGEGSVMFFLEPLSRAEARGATPICLIRGIEFSFDGCVSGGDAGRSSLENLLNSVINKAGVEKSRVGMVCYNSWNERERETVKTVLGDELQTVDLTPVIGFAPSSSPLYNLTAALKSGLVGKNEHKNYIVTFFSSLRGMSCVVVLEVF